MHQYTKHFTKSKLFDVNGPLNSEGGNAGLAITWSTEKMHYTIGNIRNSYGDWSNFTMIGITARQNVKSQWTLNLGVADNYDVSYTQKVNREFYEKMFPKVLVKNKMVIVPMATYKRKVATFLGSSVGLQVNLSPIYVNAGLFIKL